MEDYDTFVLRRLSQLRKSEEEEEEHSRPSSSSSLIRFCGRPILPPPLSRDQREEMQRLGDEVKRASVCRRLKQDLRMTFVQTILHSIQLRKTPTLEELLQESEINTQSSLTQDLGSGSASRLFFDGTEESVLPSAVRKAEEAPLTSTTYSSLFAQSVREGFLTDHLGSRRGSRQGSFHGAAHRSLSSGHVTNDDVEHDTSVSGRIDARSESLGFGSSDAVCNTGGFFLHNTSNTIAKMPDIISHPPVDGEELERSGLELSFCDYIIGVQDICCSSPQEDSVRCDHVVGETSESLEGKEHEDDIPTTLDSDEEGNLDQKEGSVVMLEKSGFSDNPDLSQTPNNHLSPTTDSLIQHDLREAEPLDHQEDEADSKPSEEPYRLSLQALLKKSQEYRRRQRTLRNRAKNTKIQERSQEQPRAKEEEQSLSDKENDEFPHKVTVTADAKKTREGRGTSVSPVDTSPMTSWENEKMMEREIIGENGDGNSREETTLKNNKLNRSKEVMTKPQQISAFIQQDGFNTCPSSFYRGVGKYGTIPAPNLCKSPVHYKSRGSIGDGQTVDGEQKVVVGLGLNEDQQVGDVILGHKHSHTAPPSTVRLMVEGGVSAMSSQHAHQLESNLSTLQELISDLESTVKQNSDNHCQTESNSHSEFSFKGIELLDESDGDCWEVKLREDDDVIDEEYRELPGRQSFNSCKNMHEGSGAEPSIGDTDDVPVAVQEKEAQTVNCGGFRLVQTSAPERGKTGEEGPTKSCRKQQPPAACISSVAQQTRVPDVFRNVPSETVVQGDISLLSDTGSHLVDRKSETAVEGQDSIRSPSLNESYDVDTPSGLWLHEGSGSDLGSPGDHEMICQSGGEGQGGVSKVKRRLLMHVTEETQETGGGSVVRPNSPRAQDDKQEQLKQAHAAQVRALQEEHRRQQEELLQVLAVRYRLLQSVAFPSSMSASRLGDTMTFSTLSQPSSPLSQRYRPLLAAAMKGFLTRRLLRTERVAQLVRTIRDTQQFQQQSAGRGEFISRQDLLLQERVALQLRAARYEVSDIFSLSARERMQLISWDREMNRERDLRRQSGHAVLPRRKSSLSAATQKSLQRKREIMIHQKATERQGGVKTRTGAKPGESKRAQFRANPRRVPKSTSSSRPR